MNSNNRQKLFKELAWKEKRYFFYEEVFDGHIYMKKYILILSTLITIIEIIKFSLSFAHGPKEKRTLENFIVPILIAFGLLISFISHLKPFERRTNKVLLLRLAILLCGNLFVWAGVFLSVRNFLRTSIENNDPINWFDAISCISNGIYITLLSTIVNPLWQLKAITPTAYFIAIFATYIESGLPEPCVAWVELFTSIAYLLILFAVKEHFRWKLFIKKCEKKDWNLIHEFTLNKVNNAIVVIDSQEKVVYSNKEFQDLSQNDVKGFFAKIGYLRRREDKNGKNDASLSLNLNPKTELIEESKLNLVGSTRSSRLVFLKNQPDEVEDVNELIKLMIQSLQEGQFIDEVYFTFDGKWKERTGSNCQLQQQKLYEVTISPLGSCNKIILIFHDTTYLSQIMKLEANNQYKDKLLASVSHELRTPLNGNLALVESALNHEKVPQSVKDDLLLPAYRSGKLLGHLINDILDYSQIKAEKIRLVFKGLSIRQTLLNCYQLLEIQAKAKKLEFSLEVGETVPESFITDHDRVSQIVLNLLSNALKFTFTGRINLKAQIINGSQLEISVEDTGIGIKPEDQLKLFQEFVQIGEDKMKMNSKGVGLGLAISNQIVKRLGPQNNNGILVDSVHGKGSRFSFILEPQKEILDFLRPPPLLAFKVLREEDLSCSLEGCKSPTNINDDSLPSIESYQNLEKPAKIPKFDCLTSPQKAQINPDKKVGSSSHHIQIKKGAILIVDDEPFNIFALQSILRDSCFDIEYAYNGKEAIEKIIQKAKTNSLEYQLIFMDCQMPVMDGFEATEHLCKMMNKEIPYIPIVGCTAFTSKTNIDDCIKSGMVDVVNKPVSKKKVYEIFNKCIQLDIKTDRK